MEIDMQPTRLTQFATPVTIWPGHRLWSIALELQRNGLVRISPTRRDTGSAQLTDKGRIAVENANARPSMGALHGGQASGS
jgi:hypothetical protein